MWGTVADAQILNNNNNNNDDDGGDGDGDGGGDDGDDDCDGDDYGGDGDDDDKKQKLKKEYLRRLRLVLGTELSAKNKILAIGSMAVPVLRYSFGIVNWHKEELQKLDRKTRKLLTIHGQHHPKADVDRLYVPRKQGGRGLMQ